MQRADVSADKGARSATTLHEPFAGEQVERLDHGRA
jgi:hypothetical protein